MNKDWEQSCISALRHLNGTYFLLGVGNFHIPWMLLILWNELSKVSFSLGHARQGALPPWRGPRGLFLQIHLWIPQCPPGADKKPWRPHWTEQLGNKCADIHPCRCHEHNWAQPALQSHMFLLRLESEMPPPPCICVWDLAPQQFWGSKTFRTCGLANQSESPGGELWEWNPPTGPISLPPCPPRHTSSWATNSQSHG